MPEFWKINQLGGKCPSCGEHVEMGYSERPDWQKCAIGFVVGALLMLALRYV